MAGEVEPVVKSAPARSAFERTSASVPLPGGLPYYPGLHVRQNHVPCFAKSCPARFSGSRIHLLTAPSRGPLSPQWIYVGESPLFTGKRGGSDPIPFFPAIPGTTVFVPGYSGGSAFASTTLPVRRSAIAVGQCNKGTSL
jgi:hypothetical protein